MNGEEQTSRLIESVNELDNERERLNRLVAGLANLLDRDSVIETVRNFLGKDPVEKGDCVVFDDFSITFGADNRVKSVCRRIDAFHFDA